MKNFQGTPPRFKGKLGLVRCWLLGKLRIGSSWEEVLILYSFDLSTAPKIFEKRSFCCVIIVIWRTCSVNRIYSQYSRSLCPCVIAKEMQNLRVIISHKDTWTTDRKRYFRMPSERHFPEITIASVQKKDWREYLLKKAQYDELSEEDKNIIEFDKCYLLKGTRVQYLFFDWKSCEIVE